MSWHHCSMDMRTDGTLISRKSLLLEEIRWPCGRACAVSWTYNLLGLLDLHIKASTNKKSVINQRPLLLRHINGPGLGLKNYSGDRKLRQSTHKVEATVIVSPSTKERKPRAYCRVGSRKQRTRSFRQPLQASLFHGHKIWWDSHLQKKIC